MSNHKGSSEIKSLNGSASKFGFGAVLSKEPVLFAHDPGMGGCCGSCTSVPIICSSCNGCGASSIERKIR